MRMSLVSGLLVITAFLLSGLQLSADGYEIIGIQSSKADLARVEKRLNTIIIDKFAYDPSSLVSTLKYLTIQSKKLDPEHVEIKFVPPPDFMPPKGPHNELGGLDDIPLRAVVEHICIISHLKYKIESDSVTFVKN